jgi:UDP-N-acetylglucosamine--N-acetylmuramyl-(pentapeptide) pyrophosphoryl-undecaprenol N-acetylglucosamine transferase
MKKANQHKRVIISGGGTGGHIFPAIAIANAIRAMDSSVEILFVGAEGRMEMEKVPAAGYKIIGLPITGLQRRLTLKNISFVFKLLISLMKASSILKKFNPDVAVGVGGYASGALLYRAAGKKIPCLIQEQNSYPGITNKLLKNKASIICVAYPGMEKFFPKEKILLTGNPVRSDLHTVDHLKKEAFEHFDIPLGSTVLLVLGGSLGARTINQGMLANVEQLKIPGLFVIWQCGRIYIDQLKTTLNANENPHIRLVDFISRMDLAYGAADLIVSRAGAGTISELCIVGRPVILIPSPNVAEDHQTSNALSLVDRKAAVMIPDKDTTTRLVPEILGLLKNEETCRQMSNHIRELALPDAASIIANEVFNLMIKK